MKEVKYKIWENGKIQDVSVLNLPSKGTLLEFTGLSDKDDKEIYEGFLYKMPDGKIAVCRYESDHGGFILEWSWSINQHFCQLTCDTALVISYIGNIYENSDLRP